MQERTRYQYDQTLDYRFIRPIRHLKNLTLDAMERLMGVHSTVISRLENGRLDFTEIYQARFKQALRKLRVSGFELATIRQLIQIQNKGRKGGLK